MKIIRYICIVVFFVSALQSCKTLKNNKRKTAHDLTKEQMIQNTSLFIDAKKELILGNDDIAEKKLYECIEQFPGNAAAYYELSKILRSKKKYEQALGYIKEAVRLNNENNWYQDLLADLLQKTGDYKSASEIYAELIIREPTNLDFYYSLALAYLYERKYDEAIRVFDRIEDQTGINEKIILQKQKVYLYQNKINKAAEELERLVEAFPYETKYYTLLGEFCVTNEMYEKAFEIFQKMIQIDPDNPNGHLGLANCYRKTNEYDKSFEELKMAFANQNLDIDTKVQILLSYYTITEIYGDLKKEAFQLAEILIKVHPDDAKSFSIYGDFLSRDKRYEEARDAFRKVLAIDSSKYIVWEQLLKIEAELNDYKALEKESALAVELFPEQPLPYFLNAYASYQYGKYEEAIKILKAGIGFVIADKLLLIQFYTQLGETYYKLNDFENAEKAFNKVLELDHKNLYVLNNYSYYLALRNENLDKAEAMSKKANELAPGNPSYQDTYGWILYKKLNYEDAEKWLSMALKNGGDKNAVILEHYGDVQYKLGNMEKALENWMKAAETGKGSEYLEQKIREKKLIEEK